MQPSTTISTTQQTNNPFASASLYVGDLASDVTEATLFELFNAVGPVASIRVCRDATTRRSLGYAYVNFHSVQDAERALDTMNFQNIRGKQCRIMWSQRDPRLRQSGKGNIFVKNLHESIDNKTLYDTFSVFGNILSCKVVMDRDSGLSRGYGYVHYVDDKSAKKAIEGVNGMKISDKKVNAELFKPREERIKNYKFTNVYVKYIPKSLGEKAVIELFEEETGGKVDKSMYWSHDFGVSACLNFTSHEFANKAVDKLNDRPIDESILKYGDSVDLKESVDDVTQSGDVDADEQKQLPDNADKVDNADDNANNNANDDDNVDNASKVEPKSRVTASALPKKLLYVARAQKKSERKEFLVRQQRKRGGGNRRNYGGANLYVKNLNPEVDDVKLHEMFGAFGRITSAKVMRDSGNKSRGFGFVAFEKKEAATRAIHEMTNTLHHGRPLYVSRAQTKAFRQTFIMKQLRNKRIRNNMDHRGGSGYSQSNNNGGYNNRRQPMNNMQGGYGGYQGNQGQRGFGQGHIAQHAFNMQSRGGPYAMGVPFGGNPMQLAAQHQALQQAAFNRQNAAVASSGFGVPSGLSVQQQAALQQQIAVNQAAAGAQQSSIAQMSSQINAQHGSTSMRQQPSAPAAASMQSGPPSASMYSSVPRPISSANQIHTGVPSQPTSVPQHQGPQGSVSQLSNPGQQSAPMLEVNPLTADMLADAKPAEKKRLIGERLFPKIQVVEPRLAGKITGMLLEMDNTELLVLLSEQRALMNKINEALAVLKDHQQKQSEKNPGGSATNPSGSAANRSASNTAQN